MWAMEMLVNLTLLRSGCLNHGVAARIAAAPDGKRLASASHDQTVKMWDATSGQELLTFKAVHYPHLGV
jgi:WD40 repeat protein